MRLDDTQSELGRSGPLSMSTMAHIIFISIFIIAALEFPLALLMLGSCQSGFAAAAGPQDAVRLSE